ncbi:MAG: hypothetical protein R2744_04505 [Bacteroidales bacterium]
MNDLRAGATYAATIRAGKEIFVNAGFMASIIHRSVNSGNIILPDQIKSAAGCGASTG